MKSKGLQPTPQREAAYEAAKAEHTPWNNRYREAKAGRRAKQMAAVDAVREREKRDWKAERAERPIRAERRADEKEQRQQQQAEEDADARARLADDQLLEQHVMARKHAATLAFALTDYKWQGKTVARLLLSLRGRRFKPSLSLTSFYTMRTRTRRGADQRTVGFDPHDESDRNRIRELRHPAALRIWNGAYDQEGRWSDARAAAIAAATSPRGRAGRRTSGLARAGCGCSR